MIPQLVAVPVRGCVLLECVVVAAAGTGAAAATDGFGEQASKREEDLAQSEAVFIEGGNAGGHFWTVISFADVWCVWLGLPSRLSGWCVTDIYCWVSGWKTNLSCNRS